MSWLVTVVTGATEVRLADGIRVPVTTMSVDCSTGLPVALIDGVGCASTGPVGLAMEVGVPSVCGTVCAKAGVAASALAPTRSVEARRRWRKLLVMVFVPE